MSVHQCCCSLVVAIFFILVTTALSQTIVRINAGGPLIVDSTNRTWIADAYFGGKGQPYVLAACPNAAMKDALYCSHRYFVPSQAPPYEYNVPVPMAGRYDIRLHFAELVRQLALAFVSRKFLGFSQFRVATHSLHSHTFWLI